MSGWWKRVDPYVAGLLAMVALSILLPATGSVAAALGWLVNAMIVLLFFGLGARLPRSSVVAALAHWRLHGLILLITYGLFPLLGLAAHALAPGLFAPSLWAGFLFLCALPSTVQSSVAFTSIARGNVAAAVTAAAGSNILGVALTPALLTMMLTARTSSMTVDPGSILRLMLLLLVPFVAGQIVGPYIARWVARSKKLMTLNDRAVILLAVYSAFSSATAEGLWARLPLVQFAGIALLCALLLAVVMVASWEAGRGARFALEDRIAVLMCGSKKSLASGVPMAAVLFGSGAGAMLVPIMLYHQIQLLVCAAIARRLGERADDRP